LRFCGKAGAGLLEYKPLFAAVRLSGLYICLMHFKLNGANLRILVEYALRFGLVTKAVRNDLSKSDMSMPMDVCDKERCSTLMQLQANGL
jgi:hypothetical protein